MARVCRILKTLPISAVSLPFSSSIMNRRPVPEVRASSFFVTPRPLRVSRTSLPMSCDVYFKSITPFIKVTVREYYSVFWAKVNAMLPYGNIYYHSPSRRLQCSRTGTKHVPVSTHSRPTTKKLEALSYPVAAIVRCRTAALGGYLDECTRCDIAPSPTTLVETGTAQSVRQGLATAGSQHVARDCSRTLRACGLPGSPSFGPFHHCICIGPASAANRERLPSSRCIESAQTHRARVCSLLTRASDTTLRLPGTDPHDAHLDYRRVAGRHCWRPAL